MNGHTKVKQQRSTNLYSEITTECRITFRISHLYGSNLDERIGLEAEFVLVASCERVERPEGSERRRLPVLHGLGLQTTWNSHSHYSTSVYI